ncbi:aminoacyl-tRNA hydrolase [Helicobacter sp. MIT 01-3238]|nr:aminoacyl-tRNA hydrolase [Helicobacter sp. MIT 01-3238]
MSQREMLLKKVASLCSSPLKTSVKTPKDTAQGTKSVDSTSHINSPKDATIPLASCTANPIDSPSFYSDFFALLKESRQDDSEHLTQNLQNPLIIVGLGNPTPKYANNRHNVGFMIVDKIAQILRLEWESATKFQAQIATLKHPFMTSTNIHLLKPQSFMNLSGEPLKNALRFYKIKDFIILHDELDIDFGSIRYKVGGSSGGHNGLKSIDNEVHSKYMRVRFGIGREKEAVISSSTQSLSTQSRDKPHAQSTQIDKSLKNHQVISYVLGDFSEEQQKRLDDLVLHSALSVLYFIITRDFTKTQNLFTLNATKQK